MLPSSNWETNPKNYHGGKNGGKTRGIPRMSFYWSMKEDIQQVDGESWTARGIGYRPSRGRQRRRQRTKGEEDIPF